MHALCLQVYVGDRNCIVTSANNTALSCNVGPGVAGEALLSVFVPPLGQAESNITVARDFAVTSITPVTGSTAGAVLLLLKRHLHISI